LVLLFLPVKVIESTAIYVTKTPSYIWYDYFSYAFSVVAIPIFLIAFIRRNKSQAINFSKVIGMSFVINIVYAIFNSSNIFSTKHYEMFLILLQAEAINCTVFSFDKNKETTHAENFLDIYFVLAFWSQILRMILGMNTFGRYGAIGLGVGGTGYFCAIYILYIVYCKKMDKSVMIRMLFAMVSLLLSGQRTCLFLCIVFLLPYIIELFSVLLENKKVSRAMFRKIKFLFGLAVLIILIILIVLALYSWGIKIVGLEYIERVLDAIVALFSRNLSGITSVSGRTASIDAGIKVWLANPFGISNDFYDLQYRMSQENYVTFPHSTLLACILLWTVPLAIFCTIYVINLWRGLVREKSSFQWIVLFIIVMDIVWGGPILDVPLFFLQLYFLSIAKVKLGKETKRIKIVFKR